MNPRVLVTGSRTWDDAQIISDTFRDWWESAQRPPAPILVSGAASRGADRLAELIWEQNGWPVERHPADWEDSNGQKNPKAGFDRNYTMVVTYPDVCIAFIRDKSNGATHCAYLARLAGIPTIIKEM